MRFMRNVWLRDMVWKIVSYTWFLRLQDRDGFLWKDPE